MSLPAQIYKKLPSRLPHSLGFNKYGLNFSGAQGVNCGLNPVLAITTAITLETCIRVDVAPPLAVWQGIITKATWPNGYVFARQITGYIVVGLRDGVGQTIVQDVAPTLGRIVHYVGRWDGVNTLNFYKNGVLIDTVAFTGLTASAKPFAIGVDSDDLISNYFIGRIFYVRVYNRALSDGGIALGEHVTDDSEILYNMLNYHNPKRTGLLLWVDMEEGAGLTAYDKSGQGNHGSLIPVVNPPTWTRTSKWELRSEIGL